MGKLLFEKAWQANILDKFPVPVKFIPTLYFNNLFLSMFLLCVIMITQKGYK